jgi:hypothetical protein
MRLGLIISDVNANKGDFRQKSLDAGDRWVYSLRSIAADVAELADAQASGA